MTDDPNLENELRALLMAGNKLEAIKRYRAASGLGLAAAKDAVKALERGDSLPAREIADLSFESEIVMLLEEGRKLEAIKLCRTKTGLGLKEAKDFVESLAADRRIVIPSRSGCLGVVLFVAVILVLLVAH